jgi:hypothetical protein
MYSYRKILRKALQITWKNKYLWFFGLFATLLSTGGEYQMLNKMSENNGEKIFFNLKNSLIFQQSTWNNFFENFASNYWNSLLALIILIGIIFLFIFILILATTSQGAIPHQTEKIINKKEKDINLKSGIIAGQKHFWPILGINILLKIFIILIFLLMSLPIIFSNGQSIFAIYLYTILFIIAIPVILSFSIITKYSISYMVIKNNKFSKAIENAWELFKKNWVTSIEMSLLLIIVNIFLVLAAIIITFLISAPFMILFVILSNFAIFWLITPLALLVLFLAIVCLGSMFTTFKISAWTILFLSLIKKKTKSKISRLKEKELKRKK